MESMGLKTTTGDRAGGTATANPPTSDKEPAILFLGLPGAGKSSLIDFLFGRKEIAKQDVPVLQIQEFSTAIQVGNEDLSIKIIDTPGFKSKEVSADTTEEENNLIENLNTYFKNHNNPDIIALVQRFDDNRIIGESSSFVKMLKGFDELIEKLSCKKPKVVLILTFFMNEKRNHRENPQEKVEMFQNLIREFTTNPQPVSVVLAENEAEDRGLPQNDDINYQLSNGDAFPQNIFQQFKANCESDDDGIKAQIFDEAYKNSKQLDLVLQNSFDLTPKEGDRPKRDSILSSIQNNEVNNALLKIWEMIRSNTQAGDGSYINELQKAMQVHGILKLEDVPQTDSAILDLIPQLPRHPLLQDLLTLGLGIELVQFPNPITVGLGYDVLEDDPVFNPIFEQSAQRLSPLGFLLESNLICEVQNETVTIGHIFDSKHLLVQKRTEELSISDVKVSASKYRGQCKGYNVRGSAYTLTAVKEHRLFKLTLRDDINLTKEFRKDIREMENAASNSNRRWEKIFKKYGTHVVVSAFGGGFSEITLEGYDVSRIEERYLGQIVDLQVAISNVNAKHKLYGGDTKFLEMETISIAPEALKLWRTSLAKNPVMLNSKLKIVPLSTFARKVSDDVGRNMEFAIKTFLEKDADSSFVRLESNFSNRQDSASFSKRESSPQPQEPQQHKAMQSCQPVSVGLKSDAKILVTDHKNKATWKSIEFLRQGDTILDKNFQPGTVVSVAMGTVDSPTFFGFDESNKFFTSGIVFEGENGNLYEASDLQDYAQAVGRTISGVSPQVKVLKLVPNTKQFQPQTVSMAMQRPVIEKEKPWYRRGSKIPEPIQERIYTLKVNSPSKTFVVYGYVFPQN